MGRNKFVVTALVSCGLFAVSMRADIIGFEGPWAPADSSGNFINGYTSTAGDGATVTGTLSADGSTLTLDFINPSGGFSLFSNYSDPSILPSGTVSYNWSVDFLQSASWLMETDVFTTFPEGDQFGFLNAGTYSGTASLNYTTGNYFSFGNIGFGDGNAHEAILTLTNFQYTGDATIAPEPGTALILGGGLLAISILRRRFHHPGR